MWRGTTTYITIGFFKLMALTVIALSIFLYRADQAVEIQAEIVSVQRIRIAELERAMRLEGTLVPILEGHEIDLQALEGCVALTAIK